MVGKRAVKSGFVIEFIVAKRSHLQIWGEKKVIPSLKFNTPDHENQRQRSINITHIA